MPAAPPPDIEALHRALCAAYPTPPALAYAMRVRLQVQNLYAHVSYYETLENQVFKLIDWAESVGRLAELYTLVDEPVQMSAAAISPLHLQYLRRWFGAPWARVRLAEVLEDHDEEVNLLDVYVPAAGGL